MTRLAGGLSVGALALLVAGCTGSPTYGTGKKANMQLMEDVMGIAQMGDKKREPIAYAPRPELVKPADGQQMALVPPQDSVTANAGGAWPESPEQRLARIKAEATANEGNSTYKAPVIYDIPSPTKARRELTPAEQSAEVKRLRAEMQQGNPNERKYLSEPPVGYRAPEATASVGDLGEDEWKKERRQKRETRKKGGLRDLLPW